jgi:hypothetical protein
MTGTGDYTPARDVESTTVAVNARYPARSRSRQPRQRVSSSPGMARQMLGIGVLRLGPRRSLCAPVAEPTVDDHLSAGRVAPEMNRSSNRAESSIVDRGLGSVGQTDQGPAVAILEEDYPEGGEVTWLKGGCSHRTIVPLLGELLNRDQVLPGNEQAGRTFVLVGDEVTEFVGVGDPVQTIGLFLEHLPHRAAVARPVL